MAWAVLSANNDLLATVKSGARVEVSRLLLPAYGKPEKNVCKHLWDITPPRLRTRRDLVFKLLDLARLLVGFPQKAKMAPNSARLGTK